MFNRLKKILFRIKSLNKSIENYKNDSVIQSLPAVAYLNKAKSFIDAKRFDEAEEILTKAYDISPKDFYINKYLGKIYENKQDFAKAVEYYETAVSLGQLDREIWFRLGFCKIQIKEYDEAVRCFEQADKIVPKNSDIYLNWGVALMKMEKYSQAREKLVLATSFNKYNYPAILLSAVADKHLKDFVSAREKLSFLVTVAPNEASFYEFAQLLFEEEKYNESIEYLNKAISVNDEMLPAYILLGQNYSKLIKIGDMEACFEKALEKGLEYYSLRYEWGCCYLSLFDFQNAKEQFLLAEKLDDNFVKTKYALALLGAIDNNFEMLHELKADQEDSHYCQALGLEKLYLGDIKSAIDLFKKSLKNDNKNTYNYYLLAQCHKKNNDEYKTKECFDKFLELNSFYSKGFVEYAKYLIELSDYEDAQRKLRRALKNVSNDVEILNLLFFTLYKLAIKSSYEYNIKEAIKIAQQIKIIGKFSYESELVELERRIQQN